MRVLAKVFSFFLPLIFCVLAPIRGSAVEINFLSSTKVLWTNVVGTEDFMVVNDFPPAGGRSDLGWVSDPEDGGYRTGVSTILYDEDISLPNPPYEVGVAHGMAIFSYFGTPTTISNPTVTSADLEWWATISDGVNTSAGDILLATLHVEFTDTLSGNDVVTIAGISSGFTLGGVDYKIVDPYWGPSSVSTIIDPPETITIPLDGNASAQINATIVATPVPEPETYLVLGSFLVLGALSRRRRNFPAHR